MIRYNQIEKDMRELFKYAFITNCHLDQSEVTSTDIEAVDSIEFSNLLEGLKELIIALLKFKKDSKSNTRENSNSHYEKLLNTMDSEVKNHQRMEQLLKNRIESYKDKIQTLEDNLSKAVKQVKDLEEKKDKENLFNPNRRNLSQTDYTNETKKLYRSEKDFSEESVKNQLSRNSQTISKNSENGIVFIKKRLEEKSAEIAKIQEKIREKINSRTPSTTSPIPSKNLRVRMDGSDISKYMRTDSKHFIKNTFTSGHERSASALQY